MVNVRKSTSEAKTIYKVLCCLRPSRDRSFQARGLLTIKPPLLTTWNLYSQISLAAIQFSPSYEDETRKSKKVHDVTASPAN